MQMQHYMKVSDMPLAVTLTTLGFTLEEIDRTQQRFQFCFKHDDSLLKAIDLFWRGEIKVDPKALFLNHKALKSRLYNAT